MQKVCSFVVNSSHVITVVITSHVIITCTRHSYEALELFAILSWYKVFAPPSSGVQFAFCLRITQFLIWTTILRTSCHFRFLLGILFSRTCFVPIWFLLFSLVVLCKEGTRFFVLEEESQKSLLSSTVVLYSNARARRALDVMSHSQTPFNGDPER